MGGRFVAIAVVLGLTLSAVPALANTLPVGPGSIPNPPPPPVSAGRCIEATQDWYNAGATEAGKARDIGLLLLVHQRDGGVLLLTETTAFDANETAEHVNTTIVEMLQGLNHTVQNLSEVSRALAAVGPGLGAILNGTAAAAIAPIAALNPQSAVIVPWTNATFQRAFNPLMAFNNQTRVSDLVANPMLPVVFSTNYALGIATSPFPDMRPASDSLEGTNQGIAEAFAGTGATLQASNRVVEQLGRSGLLLGASGGSAAESARGDADGRSEEAQRHQGSMTRVLDEDLGALRTQAGAVGDATVDATQAFPARASGCAF